MRTNAMPLSVWGVPLLGLAGLVVCLWHPQMSLPAAAISPDMVLLVNPSPQSDKSMTVFLIQEAKDVANCRKHKTGETEAQTVANYNLIAQECTPAVFKATHLPRCFAF